MSSNKKAIKPKPQTKKPAAKPKPKPKPKHNLDSDNEDTSTDDALSSDDATHSDADPDADGDDADAGADVDADANSDIEKDTSGDDTDTDSDDTDTDTDTEDIDGKLKELKLKSKLDSKLKSKSKLESKSKKSKDEFTIDQTDQNYNENCIYNDIQDESENEEELVFDDDNTPVDLDVVPKDQRITKAMLFRYERVRLLGDRTQQLTLGAKPMITHTDGLTPYQIAKLELEHNTMPLIIERPLPNGKKERWHLNELAH